MKDIIYDEFQNIVDDVLIRHSSVLDIVTKLSQASANTNRAVVKAITSCGCVTLETNKQAVPDEVSYDDLKDLTHNHLEGQLCPSCREKIEEEMGNLLFYITALSNKVDVNLYDVFLQEYNHIKALGKFTLY